MANPQIDIESAAEPALTASLSLPTDSDQERRSLAVAYACLLLMAILGSLTAPTAKAAVREIPFSILPLIRFSIAGACIMIWLWPRRGDVVRLLRESPWLAFGVAACCVPINQTFFLNGTHLAPLSHTAVIYASCPLVVTILAVSAGLERLRLDRFLAVGLSVLGVAIIGWSSWPTGGLAASDRAGMQTFWGDVLLIGAVVSWAAYMTLNKSLVQRHGAMPTLCVTFLGGAVMSLPLLWVDPPSYDRLANASAWAWANLAVLAIVISILGLALQNVCMKRFDASQVAAFGNLAPILTLVWSVLFFGDHITASLTIGALLTMSGAIWANRSVPIAAPAAILEEN